MKVRIQLDEDPESPREWDNAGTMYCWHNRYTLGDSHSYDSDTFMRELACEANDELWEKLERMDYENDQVWGALSSGGADFDTCQARIGIKGEKAISNLIEKSLDNFVILPLSLYDHSGISMSVGIHRGWDSGQVGYIVCDKATIEKEFNGDKDKAERCLENEVEVYSDYLRGNIYSFIVEDDDEEVIDCCGGFYGYDPTTNGMADHLSAELLELACNAEIEG